MNTLIPEMLSSATLDLYKMLSSVVVYFWLKHIMLVPSWLCVKIIQVP